MVTSRALTHVQVFIAFLWCIHDIDCDIDYEAIGPPMNWTSAVMDPDGSLAKISNFNQLCDARGNLREEQNFSYWTALRRSREGTYQWGLQDNETFTIEDMYLLDESQEGRCYAINKMTMTLNSRDCNSLQYALQVIDDGNGATNAASIGSSISTCLRENLNFSGWQDLVPPWSCHMSNGEYKGACKVESVGLECCEENCCPPTQTFTVAVQAGSGIIMTTLQTVPKGYHRDVEVTFNSSADGNDGGRKPNVSIKISARVFNDSARTLVVILYRKVVDVINGGAKSTNISKESESGVLYSDVVGVAFNPPNKDIMHNKVIIYFSHKKVSSGFERKCVFWEENNRTPHGWWSRDGCSVVNQSEPDQTVCSCNHVTSFAVLMQFMDSDVPPEHAVALAIITYVGCVLSLIGELLLILAYVVLMNTKAEGIQIRINLATALLLAQVVFLSGINATNNMSACVFVAALLHYLYLAAFGWMLLEGVMLYIMIVEVFNSVSLRYFYGFAWGYPLIPVIISLVVTATAGGGLQNYTNKKFCWLTFSNHLSWAFVTPVLLVSLINIGFLIAVLREIRNLKDPNPSKFKTMRKLLKACVMLSPLLGLTWVFGVLAVTDAGLVFQYLFTIVNSLQGLLIFILHVVRNSDVRSAFHHKLQKWRSDRVRLNSDNRVGERTAAANSRQLHTDPAVHELELQETNEHA